MSRSTSRSVEFTVQETGHVALYYPRLYFTEDQVRKLAGLDRAGKPKSHPYLTKYKAAQVEKQTAYIVLRFRSD